MLTAPLRRPYKYPSACHSPAASAPSRHLLLSSSHNNRLSGAVPPHPELHTQPPAAPAAPGCWQHQHRVPAAASGLHSAGHRSVHSLSIPKLLPADLHSSINITRPRRVAWLRLGYTNKEQADMKNKKRADTHKREPLGPASNPTPPHYEPQPRGLGAAGAEHTCCAGFLSASSI